MRRPALRLGPPGPRCAVRCRGPWRVRPRRRAGTVRRGPWRVRLGRRAGTVLRGRWRVRLGRWAGAVRRGPWRVRRLRVPLSACVGQASVELVAVLPLVVVLLAGAYQAVLAGEAVWQSRVAARAAARAHSLGADPAAAARAHLPARLERGLRVQADASGDVRVSVRIPNVFPSVRVGRAAATSHFRPQS